MRVWGGFSGFGLFEVVLIIFYIKLYTGAYLVNSHRVAMSGAAAKNGPKTRVNRVEQVVNIPNEKYESPAEEFSSGSDTGCCWWWC